MGNAKVFWIDETPIRQRLHVHHPHIIDGATFGTSSNPATDFAIESDNEQLFTPIGNSIYEIGQQEYSKKFSLPYNNREDIFNYTTVLHSTWESILLWTGNSLKPLGADNFKYDEVKAFIELEKLSDEKCFLFELPKSERDLIISKKKKWEPVRSLNGEFSIWFVYDDLLRHKNTKEDKIKLGQEFLNLMLCNWDNFSQETGLKKVCSIIKPQFGFFVWGANTMWKLNNINQELLLESLKVEDNK